MDPHRFLSRTARHRVTLLAALALTLLVSGGTSPLGAQPAAAGASVATEDLEFTRDVEAAGRPAVPVAGRPATRRKPGGGRAQERGTRFQVAKAGRVTAVRFQRAQGDRRAHVARLWDTSGAELAKVRLPSSGAGWQRARLAAAVPVQAGATYTVSVALGRRTPYLVQRRKSTGGTTFAALSGARGPKGAFPAKDLARPRFAVRPVVSQGAAQAAPPSAPGAFPNAGNTGVPAGTALTPYGGPRTITAAGTVIDGKQVNGSLTINAPNVTISRSQVDGIVVINRSGSLTMSDSTVDGGTYDGSAVGQYNLTLRRVEVVGARMSVSCNANCDVQDSWLHAQYIEPGSDWHGDGFISNGGSNMVLRHNTLACDSEPTGAGGACSAALALYGDFSPITDVTVDNNLFVESPAGYCMYGGYDPAKPYGGAAQNVAITNNVFARGSNRKCAAFGAAAAVARSGSNGNVWSGNGWDDGAAVRAP